MAWFFELPLYQSKRMKTLVTALVLMLACSVNAQTLSIGPVAGFGHSSLSIKNIPFDKQFFPSFAAGAKIIYSIGSHWGISTDLKVTGEGGSFKGDVSGDNYESRYRAHYIRIPIQGIWYFGKSDDMIRPKFTLGPALGFLIGGKSTVDINGEETSSADTKDVLEGFDFGVNSAFGINFRLPGNKWLITDITYYHGVSNVSASVGTIKNRTLMLNVGLIFPIGMP
jgi:hypothetical protein